MTEQSGRNTLKKVYNPYNEWLSVAESMEELLEVTVEPKTRFQYSQNGLERIPYTNKDWIDNVGTETPPHAGFIWLKPGIHYRADDELIHMMLIKHYAGMEHRIVYGIARNTLLCKAIASIEIRMDAIKETITYYLKDYTDCPLKLIERVSSSMSFIAMILVDTYADYSAEEIKSIDSKYATSRGAVDYACRLDLWRMLKSHKINTFRTRKQQEDLIDKVLAMPKFSHLSKNVKSAILLRLRRANGLKPKCQSSEDRVAEIKQKRASRIPLTQAEHKYYQRHRDLFK